MNYQALVSKCTLALSSVGYDLESLVRECRDALVMLDAQVRSLADTNADLHRQMEALNAENAALCVDESRDDGAEPEAKPDTAAESKSALADAYAELEAANRELQSALVDKLVGDIRNIGEPNLKGFMAALAQFGGDLPVANQNLLLNIHQLGAKISALESVVIRAGLTTKAEAVTAEAAATKGLALITRTTARKVSVATAVSQNLRKS